MSYVCGGGSEAGTEAPETAEEEIPCQKMHHYIRVPVHSPHHGEQPGNHRVLRSCHPPGQARLHLSTWLFLCNELECLLWRSWTQGVKWTSCGFVLRTAYPEPFL